MNYKEELFKFYTAPENFETAYEITQQFPLIKHQLLKDFWYSVQDQLKELVKDDSDWEVKGIKDLSSTYPKVGIFLKNYSEFHVIYEKLNDHAYYGLWINMTSSSLDVEQIKAQRSSIERLEGFKSGSWWVGLRYCNDNFGELSGLKRILPESRGLVAEEYAGVLFELAKDLKEDIIRMNSMER
jgi:hypothetical protein